MRRRENRSTRKKTSRSKDENQQQTQPTYDAESGDRTRATLALTTAPSLEYVDQVLEGDQYLTNRFHFAVRLYSANAQMTSKRGENKEVRPAA